jgi:hypothetical protein
VTRGLGQGMFIKEGRFAGSSLFENRRWPKHSFRNVVHRAGMPKRPMKCYQWKPLSLNTLGERPVRETGLAASEVLYRADRTASLLRDRKLVLLSLIDARCAGMCCLQR